LAVAIAASPAAGQGLPSPKGYLMIEHGPVTPDVVAALKPYSEASRPLLEKYGGKFVVSGGRNRESVEGGWSPPFIVVIEFPSFDQAKAFYHSPEYQQILPIRLAALPGSKAILVEGAVSP